MRAIITGAASGIGTAVAERLNQDSFARDGRGGALTLVDLSKDRLDAVADALRRDGASVVTIAGDLVDPATADKAVAAAIESFGGLDALISNAGILKPGSLLDLSIDDYERTFQVNTRATWLLAKAAHPHLKATQGAVVATASLAAHNPVPSLGAYAASKAALVMLIRQLASDWGPDGIRLNTVSPGSTLTGIGGTSGEDLSGLTRPGGAPGRNPLGFVSTPHDQAAMIAFLIGPDARFITGSDFIVDGGAQTQLMIRSGVPAPPPNGMAKAD